MSEHTEDSAESNQEEWERTISEYVAVDGKQLKELAEIINKIHVFKKDLAEVLENKSKDEFKKSENFKHFANNLIAGLDKELTKKRPETTGNRWQTIKDLKAILKKYEDNYEGLDEEKLKELDEVINEIHKFSDELKNGLENESKDDPQYELKQSKGFKSFVNNLIAGLEEEFSGTSWQTTQELGAILEKYKLEYKKLTEVINQVYKLKNNFPLKGFNALIRDLDEKLSELPRSAIEGLEAILKKYQKKYKIRKSVLEVKNAVKAKVISFVDSVRGKLGRKKLTPQDPAVSHSNSKDSPK